MSVRVLALVGSLRAASYNRQIAELATHVAPEGVEVSIFEGLGDVPFYNEDIDVPGALPEAARRLREASEAAAAFLVVSPEYNGTIPAVVKNTIDWLSRPYGSGAISGKPVAVIGGSVSQFGAKWAHDDIRRSVGIAGGAVVEDVELSVGHFGTRFAETKVKDDAELTNQVSAVLAKLAAATAPSA
ncbi:MAG TPA: NAD(P)H-dependent oxidoreductase [Pseudonocardia sp.]|jgi:NAD(P)H-dependent FMN reductase